MLPTLTHRTGSFVLVLAASTLLLILSGCAMPTSTPQATGQDSTTVLPASNAAQPASTTDSPLEGTLWQLTHITTHETTTDPGRSSTESISRWEHITAYFMQGQIIGSSGCNQYSAPYELEGTQFARIEGVSSTGALCVNDRGNRLERIFLDGLQTASSYSIHEQQLTIIYPNGELIFHAQVDTTANENAVYTALLREWHSDTDQQFVILNETRFGAPNSELDATLDSVPQQLPMAENDTNHYAELRIDFRNKNSVPQSITDTLDIDFPITFISPVEVAALFANGEAAGWQAFNQRYPGARGIFSVSRVGFNAAGDTALVYLGWSSQDDTGGYYSELTQHAGIWSISRSARIWGD